MTDEVVIMNREAVAMAADSAVTVQGGKIFNSANKLYMLAPGHSVGVLVFNNASFMNVPWEIIIKVYRNELATSNARFQALSEYVANFLAFLRAHDGVMISQDQQDLHFRSLLEGVIRQQIKETIEAESAKHMVTTGTTVDDSTFTQIVNTTIADLFRLW